MKKNFKFVKRYFKKNYYHESDSTDYIIQKRGCFGWKTLIEVYDGMFSYHHRWSYFCKPYRNSSYDTFSNKKECLLFLKTFYNKI